MSQESKNLKLCCFATIVAGISAVVMGIANLVGTDGIADGALAVTSGIVGIALGLWAARAANVPSNAASVMRATIIGALACVAATVAACLLDAGTAGNTGAVVACSVPAAGSVAMRVTAGRVEKTLE